MKSILLYAVASFLVISYSGFTLSQIEATQEKTLHDHSLKESFSKYELFSINTDDVYQKTRGKSENIQFSLNLGAEYNWNFQLEESGLRPEGAQTTIKTVSGVSQIPASENSIYKGYVNDNSANRVRLSIRKDELIGMIKSAGEMYFIEPASTFDQSLGKDIHIVYNVNDVIIDEHSLCGVTDDKYKSIKTNNLELNGSNTKTNRSACQLAEIAIAADGSMTVKHGSVAAVEQHILDIMNVVQDRYFDPNINIEYSITDIFIVDNPANDPSWALGSNDFGNFLNDFTAWGPTGFSATHDVASLWTNRNFSGSAVGLAWVGTVCTNNRYNVLQDFTTGMTQLVQVQTHELGHNWNAAHTASPNNQYIMAPSIGSLNDEWILQSETDIVNHKNSRSCLDINCSTTPAVPITDFSANQTTVLEGNVVQFTDLTSGTPTSWSWTITPGSAGVEWEYVNTTSATSQNPEVQFNTIGDYTVELTATNGLGSDTETKVDYISVIEIVCGDPLNTAYTMGFEAAEDLSQWVVINANGDLNNAGNQNTWGVGDIDAPTWITQNAHTGTNGAVYIYNTNTTSPGDDWIITGCMDLVAGATYTLGYWWSTDDGFAENLEVFLGTDQTVAAMNTSLQDLGTIQDVNWNEETITFTVPSSGEYYIGWHCTSAPDQYYLLLDDINLSGVVNGLTITNAPADITIECDESTDPLNTGDLTATTGCAGGETINFTDNIISGSCANSYSIERTWTATDGCGGSETHVQIITVEDNTAPVVNCGVSTDVLSTSGGSVALPNYISGSTIADNCTSNGNLIIAQNPTAGTSMTAGTYTVDITAEDECGNIGTCSVTVTVQNNEDITITNSPGDLSIECDESTDPSNTGDATATTSCGSGGLTINYTDNVTPGACINASVIERTWVITDNCGNNETIVQTITVDDNTAPVAVCGQPTDQLSTTTTEPLPDYTSGSTFSDNCTATGDLIISQNPTAGTPMSPGTYTVVISAEDECGNIGTCEVEVSVINNNGITITIAPNDLTIDCDESVDPTNTGGLTAQTSCGTGGLNTTYNDVSNGQSCPETITRTWTVTDNCGASETYVQQILVDDLTPPTADPISSANYECAADIPAPNTALVTGVSDNCTANPNVYFMNDLSNGQSCPETITRTYGVEDDCGNATEITQDFIIEDVTNPTANSLSPMTFECIADVDAPNTSVVTGVSDNCSATPTVSFVGDVSNGQTCPETITRTYEVSDDCGNSILVNQTIVIDDVTGPNVTPLSAINVQCTSDVPLANTNLVSAIDNCDVNPNISHVGDVSDNQTCPETITRTYRAEDDCGNITDVTQLIIINDNTDPIIDCAVTNETILASQESTVPSYMSTTTATDNCTSNPTITQAPAAGSALSLGSNIVTMTVTDDCGNQSTCTIDVLYEDDASIGKNELSSISFYPNPTTNILNIDFGVEVKEATIVLYDANGKLIVEKQAQNKVSETIDLSNFAKGMYTVIVHSKNGMTTQKVSKM